MRVHSGSYATAGSLTMIGGSRGPRIELTRGASACGVLAGEPVGLAAFGVIMGNRARRPG